MLAFPSIKVRKRANVAVSLELGQLRQHEELLKNSKTVAEKWMFDGTSMPLFLVDWMQEEMRGLMPVDHSILALLQRPGATSATLDAEVAKWRAMSAKIDGGSLEVVVEDEGAASSTTSWWTESWWTESWWEDFAAGEVEAGLSEATVAGYELAAKQRERWEEYEKLETTFVDIQKTLAKIPLLKHLIRLGKPSAGSSGTGASAFLGGDTGGDRSSDGGFLFQPSTRYDADCEQAAAALRAATDFGVFGQVNNWWRKNQPVDEAVRNYKEGCIRAEAQLAKDTCTEKYFDRSLFLRVGGTALDRELILRKTFPNALKVIGGDRRPDTIHWKAAPLANSVSGGHIVRKNMRESVAKLSWDEWKQWKQEEQAAFVEQMRSEFGATCVEEDMSFLSGLQGLSSQVYSSKKCVSSTYASGICCVLIVICCCPHYMFSCSSRRFLIAVLGRRRLEDVGPFLINLRKFSLLPTTSNSKPTRKPSRTSSWPLRPI